MVDCITVNWQYHNRTRCAFIKLFNLPVLLIRLSVEYVLHNQETTIVIVVLLQLELSSLLTTDYVYSSYPPLALSLSHSL